jgi:hypothetical protein
VSCVCICGSDGFSFIVLFYVRDWTVPETVIIVVTINHFVQRYCCVSPENSRCPLCFSADKARIGTDIRSDDTTKICFRVLFCPPLNIFRIFVIPLYTLLKGSAEKGFF